MLGASPLHVIAFLSSTLARRPEDLRSVRLFILMIPPTTSGDVLCPRPGFDLIAGFKERAKLNAPRRKLRLVERMERAGRPGQEIRLEKGGNLENGALVSLWKVDTKALVFCSDRVRSVIGFRRYQSCLLVIRHCQGLPSADVFAAAISFAHWFAPSTNRSRWGEQPRKSH